MEASQRVDLAAGMVAQFRERCEKATEDAKTAGQLDAAQNLAESGAFFRTIEDHLAEAKNHIIKAATP